MKKKTLKVWLLLLPNEGIRGRFQSQARRQPFWGNQLKIPLILDFPAFRTVKNKS